MSDLFSFDLADGLASGECPICFAMHRHSRRWLDAFWREGRQVPATRKRFYGAGGFCAAHAWLLHDLVGESGAAIADVYGRLAEHDLARIDQMLARRRARRDPAEPLRRRLPCLVCAEEAEALPRKSEFFLELIATEAGRERYRRSAGLCYEHLLTALATARDREPLARWLLEEWRDRLSDDRRRLAEYDRTRDHRHAAERRDDDRRILADVVRRYVGSPPDRSP